MTTWAMPNVVAQLLASARPVEAAGDSFQGLDARVASHRMIMHILENQALGVRGIRHYKVITLPPQTVNDIHACSFVLISKERVSGIGLNNVINQSWLRQLIIKLLSKGRLH